MLRQSSFQRALLYYVWRCPQVVILPLPKKIKHEREKHIKVYNVSKESKSGQHSNLPTAPPPAETLSEGVTSSASHTRQDSRGWRRARGPGSGLRRSRPPDASMRGPGQERPIAFSLRHWGCFVSFHFSSF